MAPKTGAPCGKKKKTQVAATKAVEKKKTCPRLPNTALATPGHSLAPGSHRQKQVSRSLKDGLHFPVDRIRRDLKEGRYSQRIGFEAPIYPTTIFEYLATEVLELARKAVKDNNKIHIIPRHVMLGVMCDEGISKMLAGVTIAHNGVLPNIRESLVGDGTMQDARKLLTEDAAKSSEKTTKSP